MKKLYLFFAISPILTVAQIPNGYYDGTQGLTGYKIKTKVHELISKNYNWHYGDLPSFYATT